MAAILSQTIQKWTKMATILNLTIGKWTKMAAILNLTIVNPNSYIVWILNV